MKDLFEMRRRPLCVDRPSERIEAGLFDGLRHRRMGMASSGNLLDGRASGHGQDQFGDQVAAMGPPTI